MGRPTGYIGVGTSQPTVKWWANGLADGVHWSDDQLVDSRVVGLIGQPTGYIGVGTSWPTVGLEQ